MPGGPQHIALGSHLAGRGTWAAMGLLGSEAAAGRWPAPCLPLPPLQLPGALGVGRELIAVLHLQRDSRELQIAFPALPGKGPGGCEASLCPTLVHLCPRAQGASPCQPGDLPQIFLPVPGERTELRLAAGSREEWDLAPDSSELISVAKLGQILGCSQAV